MDYGDIYYSGTSDKKLSKLQKLRNCGLRIYINNQRYVSRIQLHLLCNVSPLTSRRKVNLRKYMFKQKSNQDIVVKGIHNLSQSLQTQIIKSLFSVQGADPMNFYYGRSIVHLLLTNILRKFRSAMRDPVVVVNFL